jgi:hypothetical protein
MAGEHHDGVVRWSPDLQIGKAGLSMSRRGALVFPPAGLKTDYCPEDEDVVVEIPLLLPGWQAEALERAAHLQGLTAGELLRQLLQQYLARKGSR